MTRQAINGIDGLAQEFDVFQEMNRLSDDSHKALQDRVLKPGGNDGLLWGGSCRQPAVPVGL